jgi:hypothetical protein
MMSQFRRRFIDSHSDVMLIYRFEVGHGLMRNIAWAPGGAVFLSELQLIYSKICV